MLTFDDMRGVGVSRMMTSAILENSAFGKCSRTFQEGGIEMLTVADMGEGGGKNHQKSADILYERSLWSLLESVSGLNFRLSIQTKVQRSSSLQMTGPKLQAQMLPKAAHSLKTGMAEVLKSEEASSNVVGIICPPWLGQG